MSADEKVVDLEPDEKPSRQSSRSIFGPIVLIAIGIFFLLDNLGLIAEVDWLYALRYWPLLLIFIGLNILVIQVRPLTGTVLSGLVALLAVATFGYIALSGPNSPFLSRISFPVANQALQVDTFSLAKEGISEAEVTLNLANHASRIHDLTGSADLIAGEVTTVNGIDFESDVDDRGRAEVRLDEASTIAWVFDPTTWTFSRDDGAWEIGLSPDVPLDLRIDVGNGSARAELAALELMSLELDGGNGSLSAGLPPGNYDGRLNGSNGSVRLTLPSEGRQAFQIDGGNGSITLSLPLGMAARVEFDGGNGRVVVDERFSLVSGDEDNGVYETDDYGSAGNRVLIEVDGANGRFSVVEP